MSSGRADLSFTISLTDKNKYDGRTHYWRDEFRERIQINAGEIIIYKYLLTFSQRD